MEHKKITEILQLHRLWLEGDKDGARADMVGANLKGANLEYANLKRANLERANLASAELTDAILTDVNLARANLAGVNLARANLACANLARANLANTNLKGMSLAYANLAYANLANANLTDVNLARANLAYANLAYANLKGANLAYANLKGANLAYANPANANLTGTILTNANLMNVKGLLKALCTPITLLDDQVGSIRAYKLVNADMQSPINSKKITYIIGETIEEPDANCDDTEQCTAGISLATLDWCLREWKPGYRVLVAEFRRKDIAAIPIGSDGKFRVKKCKIVGEKDLAKLGWSMGEVQ